MSGLRVEGKIPPLVSIVMHIDIIISVVVYPSNFDLPLSILMEPIT